MIIDRVLANNPGPYTGPGTNTWLLDDGNGSVAVIDPGPVDAGHARAIATALGDRALEAVLVTHTHVDHAPMANPLARDFGVPAVGHRPGPHFEPDIRLLDGARFDVGSVPIEVVHTPGHADDHLCFRVGNVLFTGDHIMGGGSVMIERLGPYLDSLAKLRDTGLTRLHPGHGDDMDEPDAVIDWYIAHRRQRHEQIVEAIASGCDSVEAIVAAVYEEVDPALHPLAERSVAAHLTLLSEEGRIAFAGDEIVVPPQNP